MKEEKRELIKSYILIRLLNSKIFTNPCKKSDIVNFFNIKRNSFEYSYLKEIINKELFDVDKVIKEFGQEIYCYKLNKKKLRKELNQLLVYKWYQWDVHQNIPLFISKPKENE